MSETTGTQTTIPERKRPNDIEVVAAINGCIDQVKLQSLPSNVVERFKLLFCHHRVKAVCFFESIGFGLRAYQDRGTVTNDGGDEATPNDPNSDDGFVANIHGYWIRCPAAVYDEFVKNKEGTAKDYIVMDEFGRKFLKGWTAPHQTTSVDKDEDEDDDKEDDVDNDSPRLSPVKTDTHTLPDWSSIRSHAQRHKRDEATSVAFTLVRAVVVHR